MVGWLLQGKVFDRLGYCYEACREDPPYPVKGYDLEGFAERLEISAQELDWIEAGKSPAEYWMTGPMVDITVTLGVPVRQLISPAGERGDQWRFCKDSKVGFLIKKEREKQKMSIEQLAKDSGVDLEELKLIESGESPLEYWAPLHLHIAELCGERAFNLLYPGHKLYRVRLENLMATPDSEDVEVPDYILID
eukprot:CAMPEP_0170738580 /NCGR_PEP_ID=MMETSP0437-20130122/4718_1 /TAXON_ID=0 /ORGANISM="Sexangularia sp." /LENGTH=192 /DNA_ID=CAMNT_0011077007 /DNA_START=127 /DNA_END=705 /DNA_ORIENTATION=-